MSSGSLRTLAHQSGVSSSRLSRGCVFLSSRNAAMALSLEALIVLPPVVWEERPAHLRDSLADVASLAHAPYGVDCVCDGTSPQRNRLWRRFVSRRPRSA